jgi:hypothetical protein
LSAVGRKIRRSLAAGGRCSAAAGTELPPRRRTERMGGTKVPPWKSIPEAVTKLIASDRLQGIVLQYMQHILLFIHIHTVEIFIFYNIFNLYILKLLCDFILYNYFSGSIIITIEKSKSRHFNEKSRRKEKNSQITPPHGTVNNKRPGSLIHEVRECLWPFMSTDGTYDLGIQHK